MRYQIFLPCVPPTATHQGSAMILRRRDGTPFVGKAAGSAGAKAKKNLLNLLCSHAPPRPFEGATCVTVKLVFPWRKSEPKYKREMGEIPHVTRPDLDNLAKLILDAAVDARFLASDQIIHKLVMTKSWGDEVGITITMENDECST